MAGEDDMAEIPRRSNMSVSASGSRGKRSAPRPMPPPPPPMGALKYDPTMPLNATIPAHAYGRGEISLTTSDPYTTYPVARHMPEEPDSTSNKRKRMKKETRSGGGGGGDDEWIPAPPLPQPAPPSFGTDHRGAAAAMGMHMAMPTILSRSGNLSIPAVAPPPFDAAAYGSRETARASTVFNEAPVAIHSFAETSERNRQSSAASSNTVNLSHLSHLAHAATEPFGVVPTSSSAASTPKPTHRDAPFAWGSRQPSLSSSSSSSSNRLSVFDLFFPVATAASQSRGADQDSYNSSKTGGGGGGGRESKRRRRNDAGGTERTRSTASRRAGGGGGGSGSLAEASLAVDMLRFSVDSSKLIPQGLVDRIDARLEPAVVLSLIASHVAHWITRVGFDDSNFLHEITALLNAYYPCTYPTILDEVVVVFAFKRPELMERMLSAMIERLQKTGESISPAKYPVVESFARHCGFAGMSSSSSNSSSHTRRHGLACLTVLRLLLERNTEKSLLSPWIASCASHCSEDVLSDLWSALLRPLLQGPAAGDGSKVKERSHHNHDDDVWRVQHPLDQVFELLREEKQLLRHGTHEPRGCRLSMALVRVLTTHEAFKELRQTPLAQEAFEIVFGHSRTFDSVTWMNNWLALEQQRQQPVSSPVEAALLSVVRLTVANCARLSVKKTNWFVNHVLPFVWRHCVSVENDDKPLVDAVLNEIVLQHAALLLGSVEKSDVDELASDGNDYIATNSKTADTNGKETHEAGSNNKKKPVVVVVVGRSVAHDKSNEKRSDGDVSTQLSLLVECLETMDQGDVFVKKWGDKWCEPRVRVPWGYVWCIAQLALEINATSPRNSDGDDDGVANAFMEFAARLVQVHFTQLFHKQEKAIQLLPRAARVVSVAMQAISTCQGATKLVVAVLQAVHSVRSDSCVAKRASAALSSTFFDQLSTASSSSCGGSARVARLQMVACLLSHADPIGRIVRDLLNQRRRMDNLVVAIFHEGRDAEVDVALQIVVSGSHCVGEPRVNVASWSSSMVESLIALGYRPRLAKQTHLKAITTLETLSLNTPSGGGAATTSLFWSLLHTCTRHCCGCASSPATQQENDQGVVVAAFADLTKIVLTRVPHEIVLPMVGDFISQRIVSCGRAKGRWNLFLSLVLQHVVQLGWATLAASPRLVQVVVAPFDTASQLLLGAAVFDHQYDAVMQLRVLKTVCVVVLAGESSGPDEAVWKSMVRVLGSRSVRAALARISAHGVGATAAALARTISSLCDAMDGKLAKKEKSMSIVPTVPRRAATRMEAGL